MKHAKKFQEVLGVINRFGEFNKIKIPEMIILVNNLSDLAQEAEDSLKPFTVKDIVKEGDKVANAKGQKVQKKEKTKKEVKAK